MLNGGCGANAHCMPTGPAQSKCFCDENYVGDGYVCAGTLRQVIATHASLTTLNSYMNVCRTLFKVNDQFLLFLNSNATPIDNPLEGFSMMVEFSPALLYQTLDIKQ